MKKEICLLLFLNSLHTNHVTGFVKDYDGNPLSKAHVNEFAVNEWGYFRIPPDSLSEPIIVSAPFYEQKELSQEDVDTISTTYLEKNTGNSFTSQKTFLLATILTSLHLIG